MLISTITLHDLNLGAVSIKKEKIGFRVEVTYYCGLPSESVFVRSAFRVQDEAQLLARECQQKALDHVLAS